MVFKAFGRLMHRIGHPAVHVRRCSRHLSMVRWEVRSKYRDGDILMREAQQSVQECLKILLALTGLPRFYRTLDRRRYKRRLDELDALTQKAVRLFFSHLDTASLPPLSQAILYGSRARGDHRDGSDVDIVLVFTGARPDYDSVGEVCNAMAVVQSQANAALQDRTEVMSFCNWQDEFDEPGKRRNPDFYRNVLADGIDIMPLAGQRT